MPRTASYPAPRGLPRPTMSCGLFFISGHGFGHASRQVEIINALGARRPDLRVIIRSAVSPALLARTLRVPYELRPASATRASCRSTSIAHDDAATVRAAVDVLLRRSTTRVGRRPTRWPGTSVELIVGDIPPLAFEVAARLDVPSVAIANFTWDWIYETHPGLGRGRTRSRAALPRGVREGDARAGTAVLRRLRGLPQRPPAPAGCAACRRARRDETRAHFGLPARPAGRAAVVRRLRPAALDLGALDCLGRLDGRHDRSRRSPPRGPLPRQRPAWCSWKRQRSSATGSATKIWWRPSTSW